MSRWLVALADDPANLPNWVALCEQVDSLAAGSARRSVSITSPVFSWMQVSVAAMAMPAFTPGTLATASPISSREDTRSWVGAGKAATGVPE